MGKVTPEKKIYDQLAVEFLQSRGWQAFAVEGVRGWFADVLAMKGNRLAVVEVKSIKERSAWRVYEDSANLSASLDPGIARYLETIRERVFSMFPPRGVPVRKLYSVTIAAQLHRYFHEFEAKEAGYERSSNCSIKLQGAGFTKVPFLVVPAEHAQDLTLALEVLRDNGIVASFKTHEAPRLAVAEVSYPRLTNSE